MSYERFTVKTPRGPKSVFLVDRKTEEHGIFSSLVERALQKSRDENSKTLILQNKSSYASGRLCTDCGFVPHCHQCSIPIKFHQTHAGDFFGLCHICKTQFSRTDSCPSCHSQNFKLFGVGNQQIAETLESRGFSPLTLTAAKINSRKKSQEISQKFSAANIVIASELLATPPASRHHDFVIFPDLDTALQIPDFSAHTKVFYPVFEILQSSPAKFIILQTFNPDDPTIRITAQGNLQKFRSFDEKFRREHDYPPFGDLAVLRRKHEDETVLFNRIDKTTKDLKYLAEKAKHSDIEIFSAPGLIYKIFGQFRFNIILKSKNLRPFLEHATTTLNLRARGCKIDRNPDSLG